MKRTRKLFNLIPVDSVLMWILVGQVLTYLGDWLAKLLKLPFDLTDLFFFFKPLVLGGNFWRIFTFPLVSDVGHDPRGIIYMMLKVMLMYYVINILEQRQGRKAANRFALASWAVLAVYGLVLGPVVTYGPVFLGILALAGFYNPNFTLLLYFIIPIKGYMLGILGFVLMIYQGLQGRYDSFLILLLIALLNGDEIMEFFQRRQRKADFNTKLKAAQPKKEPRHRCSLCKRTDLSHPDLTFRYCSQCQGNMEYCEDHIHNHDHRSNVVKMRPEAGGVPKSDQP